MTYQTPDQIEQQELVQKIADRCSNELHIHWEKEDQKLLIIKEALAYMRRTKDDFRVKDFDIYMIARYRGFFVEEGIDDLQLGELRQLNHLLNKENR